MQPRRRACASTARPSAGPSSCSETEELPLLLPLPGTPFDTPAWSDPKVHRDFHVEVDKAIYSVHHRLVGRTLRARRDSSTVKLYLKGELVKVHPRKPPGAKSTDPADMPTGTEIYATRDVERLGRMAAEAGPSIGIYAAAILDTPLPWTKMRQVYRLLGLVKKWGPERVELACRRALDAEAVDVNLVSRMLERAREDADAGRPAPAGRDPGPLRPRPLRVRHGQRGRAMSQPTPSVSPELKVLMRRLKLGQLITTLPERLALARSSRVHPQPVPRAALQRRGATSRRRLGRTTGPGGQAGPPHGARGLGRERQDHL